MINAVGRSIPDELLINGKEVYQGKYHLDGKIYQKASPEIRRCERPVANKLAGSIREACEKCGASDGMTISFHHHFREGDYVANQVMKVLVEDMGLKDLTVAASSLSSAQDLIAKYIEDGRVIGIQTSGIRGRIGEVISAGKLKTPAIIRSHGGRPRAMMTGELNIDIAFIGASSADELGNASGLHGKSNSGLIGYAVPDSHYANKVIVLTDTLVPVPNMPAEVSCIDVDAVVVIDEIGNPEKIGTKEARLTEDPRELMMAEGCAKIIAATPYFKDGFSFQTGIGGPSLAVNLFLEKYMQAKNIKMGFALGGMCSSICRLADKGLVGKLLDSQTFDKFSIEHMEQHPDIHIPISADEYANPANKGAWVNRLDFVVLGALEIDTKFNVNVVTGSDGVLRGAPGGHPDTAAGSKCCIVVTPLIRGRRATVCQEVVTITTPGDCIDVLVTDYGIAVNPLRQDIISYLDKAGIPHTSVEALQAKAYSLVGTPDPLQWEDKITAIVEARDGSILDVVRKIKQAAL